MSAPARIVLAGQGHWSTTLADGLARYAGLEVEAVPLDTAGSAISLHAWRTIARASLLVRVGFRPGAATWRGRAFDSALSLARGRKPVAYYWIGTDVRRALLDNAAGRELPAMRKARAGARHLAGSAPLQTDLATIGIGAQLADFPWDGLPKLDELPAMPERFTVLSYVPDARSDFYGGPQLLTAARALPDARFKIMGGTGTWAPDAPENVEFLGWVKDPSAVYADSSVVVRLAEYDSIGGTAAEGLAYGRPVVYSRELPYATTVAFDDPDALVAALRLLESRHAAGELLPDEAAAAWARETFDAPRRFKELGATLVRIAEETA